MNARDLNAYMNQFDFDDNGGPAAADKPSGDEWIDSVLDELKAYGAALDESSATMFDNYLRVVEALGTERDELRALLGEWEALGDDWLADERPDRNYECAICDRVTRWRPGLMFSDIDHAEDCLRVRTRLALGKGAGDGE